MTDLRGRPSTVHDLHQRLDEINDLIPPVDWRMAVLGVFVEMGEAVQELPWRPWRTADQREPTREELRRYTDELADVICTAIRTATYLGIPADELQMACEAHVEVKRRRVVSGVDRARGQT